MIVKYLNNGVWGYIDNVRQVANKMLQTEELIRQYNEEVEKGEREDIASYMNGEKIASDIAAVNKVYLMASEITNELIDERHEENLLDSDKVIRNFPASYILYLNEHKEYNTVALITNQTTYLMNDEGQTIERLV